MRILQKIKRIFISEWINRKVNNFIGLIQLLRNRNLCDNQRFALRFKDIQYYIDDAGEATHFDSHYLYHCSWAARRIADNRPEYHIDISSSVWLSSMVSAFVPVVFYEYQPSQIKLSGLYSKQGDLLHLPLENESVISLSCLHVIEHIGLGRYGDIYDPQGDIKAAKELERVLAVHGTLLFCVPVGIPRICFNAHRIYSYEMVCNLFPNLMLKSFSLIDDAGVYHDDIGDPAQIAAQRYACGCFEFVKPKGPITERC